jgi:hypothetical protein
MGNTKSGGENVHLGKRVCTNKNIDMPIMDEGNYVLHDDLNRCTSKFTSNNITSCNNYWPVETFMFNQNNL